MRLHSGSLHALMGSAPAPIVSPMALREWLKRGDDESSPGRQMTSNCNEFYGQRRIMGRFKAMLSRWVCSQSSDPLISSPISA